MNIIGKGSIFHHTKTIKKKVISLKILCWLTLKSLNKEFNILYVSHNKKEICIAYQSKYNRKRENQVILLMITDGEKYHYLAVKSLSRLLYGITSNHHGDFYCLGCLH